MLSLLRPRCHNGLGASRDKDLQLHGAINFLVADQPERFGTSNLGPPAIEAPVARLDRALPSEGKGQRFESPWARQFAMAECRRFCARHYGNTFAEC
jgi:hypothetical protein